MNRELPKYQMVERSISKKYRKEIWNPFIEAVKKYGLIQENDKIRNMKLRSYTIVIVRYAKTVECLSTAFFLTFFSHLFLTGGIVHT